MDTKKIVYVGSLPSGTLRLEGSIEINFTREEPFEVPVEFKTENTDFEEKKD